MSGSRPNRPGAGSQPGRVEPDPSVVGGKGPGSSTPGEQAGPPSGLRNPAGAVRGVGAATLGLEALSLLLAIVPLIKLSGRLSGVAVGVVAALAAICVLLAGLLRHRWAWYAAIVVQVAVLGCGVFHLALLALGLVFGALWGYVLHVRRTVLGPGPRPGAPR